MVDIYNHSKVILITSRFEGVPTILLESLACETPVIASNVGGISEILSKTNLIQSGLSFFISGIITKKRYKTKILLLSRIHNSKS